AKRVFEVIGRADMIDDPRFASNSERVRNRALVDAAVGGWFARRTREEALAHMRAAGVTVGPVYDIADAVSDAHFREREILLEARTIAAAGARIFALVAGSEDLATAMGAEPTPEVLRMPKLLVHLAAKAAGLFSFGMLRSVADFRDVEGVRRAAREARSFGFD